MNAKRVKHTRYAENSTPHHKSESVWWDQTRGKSSVLSLLFHLHTHLSEGCKAPLFCSQETQSPVHHGWLPLKTTAIRLS